MNTKLGLIRLQACLTLLLVAVAQAQCSHDKDRSPLVVPDPVNTVADPNLTNQTEPEKSEQEKCEAAGKTWLDGICSSPTTGTVEPVEPSKQETCEKDPKKTWTGQECVDKVIDPNTLFDPALHCERKASGAWSNCKPIPRPDIEPIVVAVSPVTETTLDLIKDLTFSSQLAYSYFCPGGVQKAALKLDQAEYPLVQGDSEPSLHRIEAAMSYNTNKRYELIVNAKPFTTISSQCKIVIIKNVTTLHEASRAFLKMTYFDSRNPAIKAWVLQEIERIKDTDAGYANYLKSFLN